MPGFLLDTNVPSELARSCPNAFVQQWVYAQPEESLFLSVVTLGELRKGIALLAPGNRRTVLSRWLEDDLIPRFTDRILAVTPITAERWGMMSAHRQSVGAPLAPMDGLIAATALEHGLTLVTRNVRDFADLDVPILNPWESPTHGSVRERL